MAKSLVYFVHETPMDASELAEIPDVRYQAAAVEQDGRVLCIRADAKKIQLGMRELRKRYPQARFVPTREAAIELLHTMAISE